MSNFIRFTDTVEFKPVEVDQSKKDNFLNTSSAPISGRPLITRIAATHSGLITRNNGFYLPDRMMKGAATFTANYNKPIQVHHNQDADPIGRVLKASYVDISAQVKEIYGDKASKRYHDSLQAKDVKDNFLRFADGGMTFIESVNFITDELNSKNSILEDPNYPGLGYIELIAAISDPEAIQKLLDGRYLTGSVGVTTNRAVCSVCKQDWTDSAGRCDHRPGRVYDGVKAFLITGDLSYDEYSFVNVPADRHSRVLEVNVGGITDSVEMDESVGQSISVLLDNKHLPEGIDLKDYLSKIDTREDSEAQSMSETSEKSKAAQYIDSFKDKFGKYLVDGNLDEALASVEAMSLTDEELIAIEAERLLDFAAIKNVFSYTELASKLDALKDIRPSMDAEELDKIANTTYADANAFYTALNDAEWLDYSESEDEELEKYKLEHPEDATLKSAQRKRLPGSSFCGPNRSFPVPDCAHVTAARRLIGRAKVSAATKTRILGCVSRKASAMSCDAVAKTETLPVVETPVVTETVETNQVTTDSTNSEIENKYSELNTKYIALENSFKELTDAFETLKTKHEQMIADTATMLETYINKDSASRLEALQTELKLAHEDLIQMGDQLVNSQESLLSLQAQRVCDFKVLSGETITDQVKLLDELVAKGSSELDKLLVEVQSKVDMKKITDSINSGLTRQPSGTVTDPTGALDNTKKNYDKVQIENIANEYMRIKFGGKSTYGSGEQAANRFKADMQRNGLLPNG